MKITIKNVEKNFGAFAALEHIDLEIPSGKLVALLGPSGSGKTTLLRIIAGLEAPDAGQIYYGGDDVTKQNARERNVGFVFQHYALFGHMSVFENVAFGLRVRKWKKAQIEAKVNELLSLVQLKGMEKRLPSQLSGGQRQRVALARALASQPRILMLDEPFGALDAKVRADLRRWIRELHDEIHLTSLFVTHDQEEAFEVADYVVVLNGGKVEQIGTPDEVFARPANAFVTDFLGRVNVFHGKVAQQRLLVDGGLSFPINSSNFSEGTPISAYIRPHEVELSRDKTGEDAVSAIVTRINHSGSTVKVSLHGTYSDANNSASKGNFPLDVEISHERAASLNLHNEDHIWFSPQNVRVFAGKS
jgi:sulfate transport system ATP-binding protein